MGHRQLDSWTAKAAINGPKAGPAKPLAAHDDTAYGALSIEKRSVAEAPPVASTGPPNKPCMNRKTMKPAKVSTVAAPMVIITKRNKELR